MEKQEVTITLSESNHAQVFKQESLIHQSEFEQIKKIILHQLTQIKEKKNYTSCSTDCIMERMHNAIAILGERGTGKTSFLYTILDYYKSGAYLTDDKYETNPKINILGIIDPTLLEEKAHIFLLIISMINEKVMSVLEGKQCCVEADAFREIAEWKSALKKLAKGLPSLDKIGSDYNNDNWQDAEFIMEKGLQDVMASYKLDLYFNQLVDKALSILDTDAFMIGFDDIDINFDKGWRVLETIRKYLSSSKFIVLMSGNLKLYNLNVRQQQGKMLNIQDKVNDKEIIDMIYQLENQYMMKVFKSQNRIHLSTIIYSQYWNNIRYNIEGRYNGKKDIMEVYREILLKIGVKSYMRSFTNYLLNTSMRTQLNYLRTNWDLTKEEDNKFSIRRIDAFISRMYAGKIDVNTILNNPNLLIISMLNYLKDTKSIKDLYQLVPISENESINACLTGLTTIFSWYVKKNRFLIFDYLLRIGYIRNLIQSDPDNEKISRMISCTSLTEDISLKNIVGLCMAYQKHTKFSMAEHNKLVDERMSKKLFTKLSKSLENCDEEVIVNYFTEILSNIYGTRVDVCFLRNSLRNAYEAVLANNEKWMVALVPLKNISILSNDFVIKQLIKVLEDKTFNFDEQQDYEDENKNMDTDSGIECIKRYLSTFMNPLIRGVVPGQEINEVQKLLIYLPLCSLKYSKYNYSNLYYSFYNILGVIGEILKVSAGMLAKSVKDEKSAIKKLLFNLQLLRNYQISDDMNDDASEIQTLLSKSDINVNNKNVLDDFIDAIYHWNKDYELDSIPPYLLGKIATRFFYNVQKIKEDNMGNQMKSSVETFLNTCLIIESEENTDFEVESIMEEGLYANLKIIEAYGHLSKVAPLTVWLLNCPLLYPFLNYSSLDAINLPLDERVKSEMKDKVFSVYSILGGK